MHFTAQYFFLKKCLNDLVTWVWTTIILSDSKCLSNLPERVYTRLLCF